MNRTTRVLFHIPLLSAGGAERNLFDLAIGIDRIQFDPVVWSSEGMGRIADELHSAGIPVHHHPLDLGSPDRARKTEELLCGLRPMIFHSFSYRRDCADVLAAVFAGVPLIVTVRQNMRHWEPGRRVHDWEQIRNRMTDAVVANAQRVADECIAIERLHPRKIKVIRNGIRIPHETQHSSSLRRELRLDDNVLLAANVGNLKKQKAHDDLLCAWAEVVHQVPHAHLAICGADYGLLRELEALSRSLGLEGHVSFLGQRDRMDQVYSSIDLYVQSSYAEGLSTAMLEAMSYSCPVVATDAGGTREAVRDGETGFVVPVRQPELLAAGVILLLQDPALRRAFGEAGRRQVCEGFEISRVIREHESLYRDLLAKIT